ncbi:MAG: hypothetical protein PVH89_00650 [Gammaproteobacteria bacterium]
MRTAIALTLLLATVAAAQEEAAEPASAEPEATVAQAAAEPGAPRTLSGMSILGNEEAPKSLVIVPWKSSQLGDGLGISNALDQSPRAVDKEVFMRELHFHELRSSGSE